MRRSLTAVLVADIVGYSRLMHEDATGTLATLRRLRTEIIAPLVAARRGRVVKSMGDGWIVTFGAVADAVECAMQVQDRLKIDGAMQMRAGIHIGDVAVADEDVFGEGVNIAARLQAIADPGAVAISDPVYMLLDGTLRPSFDDAGARALKNIPVPMRVWARGGEVAGQAANLGATGSCTLTIHPVTAADGRPEVQDLAAALTGDMAFHLDAFRFLSARVSETAPGDGYVLRCTLRASGERIRLEALLGTADGTPVERLRADGDLQDVFDWQDQAAPGLCGGVLRAIIRTQLDTAERKPEADRTADDWVFLSMARHSLDLPGHLSALQALEHATRLQPGNGFVFALALVQLISARSLGYGARIGDYADRFDDWAERIDRLEPPHSPARILLAFAGIVDGRGDPDGIRASIWTLTRQMPFDPELLFWTGWACLFLGEPDAALEHLERLHPAALPHWYEPTILSQIGFARLLLGQYDKALAPLERSLALAPGFSASIGFLISLYGHLGRLDEARALLGRMLSEFPGWSISRELHDTGFVETDHMRHYFDGLRKAGVPD